MLLSSSTGKIGMASLWTDLNNLGIGYETLYEKRIEIGIEELDEERIQGTLKDVIDAIVDAMKVADPSKPSADFKLKFEGFYKVANPNGTPQQAKAAQQNMMKNALDMLRNLNQNQSSLARSVSKIAAQQDRWAAASPKEKLVETVQSSEDLYYMPDSSIAGAPWRIYLYIKTINQTLTGTDEFKQERMQMRLLPISTTSQSNSITSTNCRIVNANILEFDFDTSQGGNGAYSVEIWVDGTLRHKFERPFIIEPSRGKK
jgi:hypothetical protein